MHAVHTLKLCGYITTGGMQYISFHMSYQCVVGHVDSYYFCQQNFCRILDTGMVFRRYEPAGVVSGASFLRIPYRKLDRHVV